MPCFSLKLSYDDFLKANFKKSIVLSYDKCKDSEQKCLESFLFCAKSCKIHKKVILSFLETTFLNEGFVILDKQKKRAYEFRRKGIFVSN